jgi:hypothetical protein
VPELSHAGPSAPVAWHPRPRDGEIGRHHRPHHQEADLSAGETLQAALRITNSGMGHYFPIYVTPRVVVRFEFLGKDGQSVSDTQKEAVIGRNVPLDLSRELSDTRIPAGETFTIKYSQRSPGPG